MDIDFQAFDLVLKDPFRISRGEMTVQPTLIVKVEHEGHVGLGEATSNSYYGVTIEKMQEALESVRSHVKAHKLENPAELWKELDPQLSSCRFAQCALDCAVWDLYSKLQNKPLWELWGFRGDDPRPPTCFTIGIADADEMVRKMNAMPEWPVYKIKVDGTGGLDLVKRLRNETDAKFRVDANCAWEVDQVAGFAEQLAELNVELIEQPLPAECYDQMKTLKGKCALPLMADESCQEEADVDRCLDTFDAINIKLVKCGGLTPARRMIARAKQRGLEVMVGCMTESSVGISAGVNLLPLLDYADLDGALLLKEDIAEGLTWEKGYCQVSDKTGLGVSLC